MFTVAEQRRGRAGIEFKSGVQVVGYLLHTAVFASNTPRAFNGPVALVVPQIPGRAFNGQQPGALGQETGFQQGAGKADESAALSLPAAWA